MRRWYVGAQLALNRLSERLIDERGATAVEYALMVAFIAAVIVASVTVLGRSTNSAFSKVTFP
jgi:pilus assembly protein Flp/PilA